MTEPNKVQVKKKPVPAPPEPQHATVPARLSPDVHQFIISKAKWGESIDKTLRRLLKIPAGWVTTASVAGGRP
jgi:hypothetical protein